MPKIKLVRVSDSGYEDQVERILSHDTDGWEEVSTQDLELLKKHRYDLYKVLGEAVVIIEQLEVKQVMDTSVPKLLKMLKEQKNKQEKERQNYLEKEKERKAKLEAKKIEKAQKLLKEKGIL